MEAAWACPEPSAWSCCSSNCNSNFAQEHIFIVTVQPDQDKQHVYDSGLTEQMFTMMALSGLGRRLQRIAGPKALCPPCSIPRAVSCCPACFAATHRASRV